MDLNLAVICGELAAQPEATPGQVRLLVTARTTRADGANDRLDVVPVLYDSESEDFDKVLALKPGDRIWVVGRIQRRMYGMPDRRTRIVVMADQVTTA